MAQATNNFTLTGNIVKNPDAIKETKNGKKYTYVSVAVNRMDNQADFFNIFVWDSLAANAVKYIHKGDCVSFHGYISTMKRDNRTELLLTADSMTFLRGSKNSKPDEKVEPEKDKFEKVSGDIFAEF